MCNRYVSPETAEAERFWRVKESNSRRPLLPPINVFPRKPGAVHPAGAQRELPTSES
jgi:hypothetical protein